MQGYACGKGSHAYHEYLFVKAIDNNGRKPKDYQYYENSAYCIASKYYLKLSKIEKIVDAVYAYYRQLLNQGFSDFEAIDHTFEKFPCLQR